MERGRGARQAARTVRGDRTRRPVGRGAAPPPVADPVRLMTEAAPLTIQRIAIFPLPGAVLFPGLHLPLHIFEPRYRAMVQEVLARDRQIGKLGRASCRERVCPSV